MTTKAYYGNRSIQSMLRNWNALRTAVQTGDVAKIQESFDTCEEWIDFALGRGLCVNIEDRSGKGTSK